MTDPNRLDENTGWCPRCGNETEDEVLCPSCSQAQDELVDILRQLRESERMSPAIPSRASRYSATVTDVRHWTQPADKRQDVDRVLAHLDYAHGAAWWLVDEGTVKIGDRYLITVERAADRAGHFEDTRCR